MIPEKWNLRILSPTPIDTDHDSLLRIMLFLKPPEPSQALSKNALLRFLMAVNSSECMRMHAIFAEVGYLCWESNKVHEHEHIMQPFASGLQRLKQDRKKLYNRKQYGVQRVASHIAPRIKLTPTSTWSCSLRFTPFSGIPKTLAL